MRSEYPILDNRPIDQWKVTELKEELRRRKLTTKGLKEDLVKRLDEAIRIERELFEEKELDSSVDPEEPQDKFEEKDPNPVEISQIKEDATEAIQHDERKTAEYEVTMVDVDGGIQDAAQGTEVQHELVGNADLDGAVEETVAQGTAVQHESMANADLDGAIGETVTQGTVVEHETIGNADLDGAVEEIVAQGAEVQHGTMINADLDGAVEETESRVTEVQHESMINADLEGSVEETVDPGTEVQHEPMGNTDLDGAVEETVAPGVTEEDNLSPIELTPSKSDANCEDFGGDTENRDSKPPAEDTTFNLSEPKNQVSEISPDLGFQVKCESISTDSVSINEKIELKDNFNANNFHLELEVGKLEMVQPSSSDVAPVAGDFNPLDNDQEPEDNQGSVEEIDDVANTTSLDLSNKIDNSIGGSPEKLNLDRSSGDESMEEDVLETKQSESNNNSDEVGDTREIRELHVVKEGSPVDAMVHGLSPDKKAIVAEESRPVVPAEKRKLEDQGSLGTTEPVKRQRRWNAETLKVPEPQTSNQTSTTPKDIFQTTPRRIFTRTDSGLSVDSPKERFVPPTQKTPTTSLRIDRFLRPFTLKAVQELLAKTGTVCSFWMDHIKTHCYVTYSSVEEALATRNALYNLQWPPNGGRLLTADFVDPQEVKTHVEAPPQSPATPASPSTAAPPSAPSLERPNAAQPPPQSNRQQLPPPPLIPQPPPVLQPPPARERERLPLPPPPPAPPAPPAKKSEPPILTLDDLFKKTRATPRIYYLPLSEEQVAAKLAAQGRGARV